MVFMTSGGTEETSVQPSTRPMEGSFTTLSTIAIQAGQSQIVVSVLKSGFRVHLQLVQVHPGLCEVGSNQEQNQTLIQQQQELIKKLKSHEPEVMAVVEERKRKRKDEGIIEEEGVFVAMAASLTEGWSLLVRLLERRQEVLEWASEFYHRILEFSSSLDRLEALKNFPEVYSLQLTYQSTRRDVLEKSLQVLRCSSVLLQNLRQLQRIETLQRRGGVLQEDQQNQEDQDEWPQSSGAMALRLEQLVETLQDRRRRADLAVRLRLQQVGNDNLRGDQVSRQDLTGDQILDQHLASGCTLDLQPGSTPELQPGSIPDLQPGSASDLKPGSTPDLKAGSMPNLKPDSTSQEGADQRKHSMIKESNDLSPEAFRKLQSGFRLSLKTESGSQPRSASVPGDTGNPQSGSRSYNQPGSKPRDRDLCPEFRILDTRNLKSRPISRETTDLQSESRSEKTNIDIQSGSKTEKPRKLPCGSRSEKTTGFQSESRLEGITDLQSGSRSEKTTIDIESGSTSEKTTDLRSGSRSEETTDLQSGSRSEIKHLPEKTIEPQSGIISERTIDRQSGSISDVKLTSGPEVLGSEFDPPPLASAVQQPLQLLGRIQQKVDDLWCQQQIQTQHQQENCRRYQKKLVKTRQDLTCVSELLDSCTLMDLGSDMQTSRLLERFSHARPHFTRLDIEVEVLEKDWETLRIVQDSPELEDRIRLAAREEDLSDLVKLQKAVKNKIHQCESILELTSRFHLTSQKLETLIQRDASSPVTGPVIRGTRVKQQEVQSLLKTASTQKNDIITAVTNSGLTGFAIQQLEARLNSLDSLSDSWLKEEARRDDERHRALPINRMNDDITQLRNSFEDLEKCFSDLKTSFLKRNDRTRNTKATRNQLQQVELYQEKLKAIRKHVQGMTARLGSEIKDGGAARNLEDAINELQVQMGDFERSMSEHQRTLELSCRLQTAMEEYQLWCEAARGTIALVEKFWSECRSADAVSVLKQQFEKFVWPTIPEQEERISQISELAIRLHGLEEGRRFIEKTVSQHSDVMESIRRLSDGLRELETRLKKENLRKQQNDGEKDKRDETERWREIQTWEKGGEEDGEKERDSNGMKDGEKDKEEEGEKDGVTDKNKVRQGVGEVDGDSEDEEDEADGGEEDDAKDEEQNEEEDSDEDVVTDEEEDIEKDGVKDEEQDGEEDRVKYEEVAGEDSRNSQEAPEQSELKETCYKPHLTAEQDESDVPLKAAANEKPLVQRRGSEEGRRLTSSHSETFSASFCFRISPSPVDASRRIHIKHNQSHSVNTEPQATLPSPISPSLSVIQREELETEQREAPQDALAGGGSETELQRQEVMSDDSISSDEYECASPDDISLPPLAETPESIIVQSDVEEGFCSNQSSHQIHFHPETRTSAVRQQRESSQAETSPTSCPSSRFRSESSSFGQGPLVVPAPRLMTSTLVTTLKTSEISTDISRGGLILDHTELRLPPIQNSSDHCSNKDNGNPENTGQFDLLQRTRNLSCNTGLPSILPGNGGQQVYPDSRPGLDQGVPTSQTMESTQLASKPQTNRLRNTGARRVTGTSRVNERTIYIQSSPIERPLSQSETMTQIGSTNQTRGLVQRPRVTASVIRRVGNKESAALLQDSNRSQDYPESRTHHDLPSSLTEDEESSIVMPHRRTTPTTLTHKHISRQSYPPKIQRGAPQFLRSQRGSPYSVGGLPQIPIPLSPEPNSFSNISLSSFSRKQSHIPFLSQTTTCTQQSVHDTAITPSCTAQPTPPPEPKSPALAEQANTHVTFLSSSPHPLTPDQDSNVCQPLAIREEIRLTPQIQGPPLPAHPEEKASRSSPSSFTRPLSRATVMGGSPVTLEVKVTGPPEPTLTWSQNRGMPDGAPGRSRSPHGGLPSGGMMPAGEDRKQERLDSDGQEVQHQDTQQQARTKTGTSGDSWILRDVYEVIAEDWNTLFGTLCVVLWLLYLIVI